MNTPKVIRTSKKLTGRTVFLIFSEVPRMPSFKRYYQRNWPMLSEDHGFVFLGFAMVVLGNNILGNLNKEATSQESLGMPFWRLAIGSGIIVFVFGFVNIVAVSNHPHPLRCLTPNPPNQRTKKS